MSKARILVVEDNPLNMELVTDLLELFQYEILQAPDAEQGIRLARDERPDLILMDISLPGMDGLEATTILRGDSATAAIPIIAVTAHAMKGDEEKIQAAGCDGYITKPIDTRTFPQEVARHLG